MPASTPSGMAPPGHSGSPMQNAALEPAVAAAYGWSAQTSDDEVLRESLPLHGGGQ